MDNGGPAFPHVALRHEPQDIALGLSVRDYFAAKFAHAELVTAGALKGPALALAEEAKESGREIEEQIAFNAYLMADAMLKAREK